ncbi:MAG: bifunctional metallophosphatase/5'-nucleotidase [Thermoflexales bacterium]|nr:bifunctional metallophosphatase/5'-nucleotidase [Thermoflexales bacterium]
MIHLTILHTNDIHARVEPLSRIATLVKRIRGEVETAGGYCTVWDGGDAEDTIWLESSATKGGAMMAVLRSAGYDLAVLGNATPLRYGPQAIGNLAERFGRPLLGANMLDAATGQPVAGLEPYTVQTFGDLKLGVIGLTDPMPFYSFFDTITLGNPLSVLPGLIAQARSRGAQTVALLSHLGSPKDKMLAEQVSGLDLIIGGHDHLKLSPPLVVNGVVIAQAGDYGQFLGRLDLEIDPTTGKITGHTGELIPVGEDIPPEPETVAALETERERMQQMMQRVIGELRAPIDKADDRQCAAGNLLADILLDRVKGAHVALAMVCHWTTGLDAGPLTLGALNSALRSTGNPARAELSGEQIRQFLRQALKPDNAARTLRPLRGVPVGMPHVAGMWVRYDPESFEPVEVRIGGEPLQAERKYVVAATDLEFSEILNYLVVPDQQVEYEVPTIVPEVMEEYVAKYSPLGAPSEGRITP